MEKLRVSEREHIGQAAQPTGAIVVPRTRTKTTQLSCGSETINTTGASGVSVAAAIGATLLSLTGTPASSSSGRPNSRGL